MDESIGDYLIKLKEKFEVIEESISEKGFAQEIGYYLPNLPHSCIVIGDAYIYLWLCRVLNEKYPESRLNHWIQILYYKDDCDNPHGIKLTLGGSNEAMDRFNKVWDSLDHVALRIKFNEILDKEIDEKLKTIKSV